MDNTQPNYYGLSAGESIYHQAFAVSDIINIEKPRPPKPVMIMSKDEPGEPKKVYRRAGRKKLTAAQIVERDLKELDRRTVREEERRQERLAQAEKRAAEKEAKAARKAKAAKELERKEQRQSLRNKPVEVIKQVVAPMIIPAEPKVLPAGVLATTGTPQRTGYQTVRVDHKTVIEIPVGRDPEEAIARYRLRHS